jgi:uncharacterized membrane protein
MTGSLYAATLATALGCGLVAGVFFAFSAFVMDGLERLPATDGIAAMQSINRTAVTPLFMTVLFGTAAACVALAVWARRPWVLGGAALYLVGAIGVTIAANVPRNDRLAALAPDGPAAAGEWARFVHAWTAWNHVRGVAALGAAALLTVALTTE